jgi:hypothetical protein
MAGHAKRKYDAVVIVVTASFLLAKGSGLLAVSKSFAWPARAA